MIVWWCLAVRWQMGVAVRQFDRWWWWLWRRRKKIRRSCLTTFQIHLTVFIVHLATPLSFVNHIFGMWIKNKSRYTRKCIMDHTLPGTFKTRPSNKALMSKSCTGKEKETKTLTFWFFEFRAAARFDKSMQLVKLGRTRLQKKSFLCHPPTDITERTRTTETFAFVSI